MTNGEVLFLTMTISVFVLFGLHIARLTREQRIRSEPARAVAPPRGILSA